MRLEHQKSNLRAGLRIQRRDFWFRLERRDSTLIGTGSASIVEHRIDDCLETRINRTHPSSLQSNPKYE